MYRPISVLYLCACTHFAKLYMCVCTFPFCRKGEEDFTPLARGWKQPSGMSRLSKLLWLPDGHNMCYIRHVKRITGTSFKFELEERVGGYISTHDLYKFFHHALNR